MNKVLIFTPQIQQLGGQERLSIELALELNRVGIHADILCMDGSDVIDSIKSEQKLKKEGIPNIYHLGFSRGNGLLSLLISIYRLRKLVKNGKYDAIEVSGFGPSLLTAISLLDRKVKVVQGIHQVLSDSHSGSLRYRRTKIFWAISYRTTLYAISESSKASWCRYIGIGKNRIVTILNSIDQRYYSLKCDTGQRAKLRLEIGAQQSSRLVLFVGRLMRSKGVDTLYNALREVLIQKDLHLIFVGREDNAESQSDIDLISAIKSDFESFPWRDRVHFLGEREDIMEIMSGCDILVHPARKEGFGLILAEALAVGLPIVASNVDGIPEVLQETDSILIPPENAENELEKAVSEILNWTNSKLDIAISKGKKRAEIFKPVRRAKAILDLIEL